MRGRYVSFSRVFLAASLAWAVHAQADNAQPSRGAGTLLNKLGVSAPKKQEVGTATLVHADLSDPFLIQFFAQWQVQKDLPYDVKGWVGKIFKRDYQGAAHLWTPIQKLLPEDFRVAGESAYLYLLWKLNLGQTFFDEWVNALGRKSFLESRTGIALDQTISPDFDKWLLNQAIDITTEQRAVLSKVDPSRGSHIQFLASYMALRGGAKGRELLDALPSTSPLKVPLANTVALSLARANDLAGAGTVLQQSVETALEAQGDYQGLGKHYLEIARLLYQAGAIESAAEFYQKVPTGVSDYLKAREELAWVWLRSGQTGKLRGELESLKRSVFEDTFAPDVFVVRSISNLKLCYYREVEKDLQAFVEDNKRWAGRITEALTSEAPRWSGDADFFVSLYENGVKKRAAERELLTTLAEQSIAAVLPAVGPQQHWEKARLRSIQASDRAGKKLTAEYRRQWKNRSRVLAEAIRKMQFVKVELYSQVRMLAQQDSTGPASDASDALVRDTNSKLKERTVSMRKDASAGEMVFPFDGVVWPDELFRLTSVAESRCQSRVAQ